MDIQEDLGLLDVEILLAVGAVIILISGLLRANAIIQKSMLLGILVFAYLVSTGFYGPHFSGFLQGTDFIESIARVSIIATGLLVLFKERQESNSGYYSIILLILLGGILLLKSRHLLLVYLYYVL